jgi:hypothetical protein
VVNDSEPISLTKVTTMAVAARACEVTFVMEHDTLSLACDHGRRKFWDAPHFSRRIAFIVESRELDLVRWRTGGVS